MKPTASWWFSTAAVLLLGCQGLPTGTKAGQVIDVPIRDDHVPEPISVKPGDEVRWVNKRSGPVRVIVLDRLPDEQLSCKSHFGGFARPADTARLTTTDTASICFRNPGIYKYVIRMEMDRQTPERNVAGEIRVEPDQAARQSPDSADAPK